MKLGRLDQVLERNPRVELKRSGSYSVVVKYIRPGRASREMFHFSLLTLGIHSN